MELALAGLFLRSRDHWTRLHDVVNKELLDRATQDLVADVADYYDKNPEDDSCGPRYLEWVKLHRKPTHTAAKWQEYCALVREAYKQGDSASGEKVLTTLSLRADAMDLAYMADQYAMGNPDIDLFGHHIYDFVEQARQRARIPTDHTMEVRCRSVAEVLARRETDTNRLHWRSTALDRYVGPLTTGDLVVVAAYVETGKSRTVLGEALHMATQCTGDETILMVNNEEAGEKVWLRSRAAALGWTDDELSENRHQADQAFLELMGGFRDRFVLMDGAGITAGHLRAKLRQYNVRALVIDQLAKIKGLSKGGASIGDLDSLQRVFMFAREIAKEHCPVIAVHQAWGDASPEQRTRQEQPNYYLSMHELAGSRQIIQAEADAIIMIGMDPNDRSYRYVSIPKNKLTNQHARLKVAHDLGRCRLESEAFDDWDE